MDDDVEFACNCGYEYACLIAELFDRPIESHHLPDLSGLSILELGPGMNFGPMLICAASGASQVAVADKYLVEWNDSYHPAFYHQFLQTAITKYPSKNWNRLANITKDACAIRDYVLEISVDITTTPQHEIRHKFDAIVSNAVLEHIEDMDAMAVQLSNITNKDGVGIHQVDFRDHSNPDKPLEFLRTPTEQYTKIFREALGGGGNRIRPCELEEIFSNAGFDVLKFHAGTLADATYVNNIRPHILARFAAMGVEQLQIVGGRFFLRKKDQ